MNNIVREVVHRLGSFYLHLVCIVFKKAVDGRFVVFQGFAFLLLIGHRLSEGVILLRVIEVLHHAVYEFSLSLLLVYEGGLELWIFSRSKLL